MRGTFAIFGAASGAQLRLICVRLARTVEGPPESAAGRDCPERSGVDLSAERHRPI
jgi:hypothetical protein